MARGSIQLTSQHHLQTPIPANPYGTQSTCMAPSSSLKVDRCIRRDPGALHRQVELLALDDPGISLARCSWDVAGMGTHFV